MYEQGSGYYQYDFSNPKDTEKLIAGWGGESVVKTKYPAVWKAIQDTGEYEHELKKRNGSVRAVEGNLYVSAPGFAGGDGRKGTEKEGLLSVIQLSLEDGTYLSDQAGGMTEGEPVSKTWPAAVVAGSINNLTDGYHVASFTKVFRNINSAEAQMRTNKIYDGTEFSKKRVNAYAKYSGTDFNGCLHCAEYVVENPNFTDEEGDMFVREFSVSAPCSKQGNQPIKMLYDRGADSGETVDYSYKNVRDDANRQVKTCIPLKAQLQFKDEISLDKQNILDTIHSFKPSLEFGDPPKKHVEYNRDWNEIKKAFTVDGKILSIDFSGVSSGDDWNCPMLMTNYTTGSYEVGRTLSLHASFWINVTYGGLPTGIPISIVSQDKEPEGFHFYHSSNNYDVYIPRINIRWGCFGEGTLIRMADGSRKPVERIRMGDVLFTMLGDRTVREVYAGPEKILLCICTESGKKLKVTYTHPIVLEGGITLQAGCVRPGYRVLSGEGETDKVKWVYECDYQGMVYNFEFTDGQEHTVEADGILAGDFIAQNSLRSENVRTQVLTPQMQSLAEQFIAMHGGDTEQAES